MTGVISLGPNVTQIIPNDEADVVDVLEVALRLAKAGKLNHIVVVAKTDEEGIYTSHSSDVTNEGSYYLLGQAQACILGLYD